MKDDNRLNPEAAKKPSVVKRALAILLLTAVLLTAGGYGAMYILFRGPFVHAAAAFVQDVGETPVGNIVVGLFVTSQERKELLTIDSGTGIADGHEKTFSVYPQLG